MLRKRKKNITDSICTYIYTYTERERERKEEVKKNLVTDIRSIVIGNGRLRRAAIYIKVIRHVDSGFLTLGLVLGLISWSTRSNFRSFASRWSINGKAFMSGGQVSVPPLKKKKGSNLSLALFEISQSNVLVELV